MKTKTGWGFLAAVLLGSGAGSALAQDYAGQDRCISCHEDQAKSYQATGHGQKSHPDSPASAKGCESCHAAGAEHARVAEETGEGQTPPRASAEACLSCHGGGNQALWKGSSHEGRGVDCLKCHAVHGGNPKNLAKPTAEEVCTTCHKNIDAQTKKNSHHPIREGKVSCADCHNPHGTVAEKLISANTLNEKCYQCHAEKRGPFLWEHAPATEDCGTCHTPHGSTHQKLLKAREPGLCQRCHSNSRHPGTLYSKNDQQAESTVYEVLGNRVFYRSCQNCHAQIHGSNHPSGKTLAR